MALLVVPPQDVEPWPTLGPQVCALLEGKGGWPGSVFGPGSLKGQRYVLDAEKRALIYAAYEVYPQGHQWEGRRRYKRVGYSVRKGLAKTELLAQVAYVELHPDGPVRCDGFDANGEPVGRPVVDPYIPLLSYQKDQTEELAYGALYFICTEGPDADLFDATNERILRLGLHGQADGKCVPLAGDPGARDGARTSFQGFDEPHRLFLPRLVEAHETMVANLEKRVMEDPWGLYVGTAGEPGQGSVAEQLHREGEAIARGEQEDPQLFYFHRWAGEKHDDLATVDKRVTAIADATGPIGEYGPGQFHSIAKQWDRVGADKAYLERVWLNRWGRSGSQAFDLKQWQHLERARLIPDGAFVTIGFDGARFRDATAMVITDIRTGRQRLWGLWERPDDDSLKAQGVDPAEWEVPEAEVDQSLQDAMKRYEVWKGYFDPPHWTETVGAWAGRYPDQVSEWWTTRTKAMAFALKAYREAQATGACTHEWGRPGAEALEERFDTHIAAAGRKDVMLWDDEQVEGREQVRMWVLRKIHPTRKFDAAMAGTLSWACALDARREGAKPRPKVFAPRRLR